MQRTGRSIGSQHSGPPGQLKASFAGLPRTVVSLMSADWGRDETEVAIYAAALHNAEYVHVHACLVGPYMYLQDAW